MTSTTTTPQLIALDLPTGGHRRPVLLDPRRLLRRLVTVVVATLGGLLALPGAAQAFTAPDGSSGGAGVVLRRVSGAVVAPTAGSEWPPTCEPYCRAVAATTSVPDAPAPSSVLPLIAGGLAMTLLVVGLLFLVQRIARSRDDAGIAPA